MTLVNSWCPPITRKKSPSSTPQDDLRDHLVNLLTAEVLELLSDVGQTEAGLGRGAVSPDQLSGLGVGNSLTRTGLCKTLLRSTEIY